MPPSNRAWAWGGPETQQDDIVHMKRATVVCSKDVRREQNPKDGIELIKTVEEEVKTYIEGVIRTMNERKEFNWEDPDFGPTQQDPRGTNSLYRNGRSVVPGYPKPEEIRWAKPRYKPGPKGIRMGDVEKDYFCKNGVLFKDQPNPSTICQGKLGDCWFLNAVAIAATQPELLQNCFWRLEDFKDYGIYVCRFFKNGSWYYVIIDDRIPVFDCPGGKPCFSKTKDPDELWLPLLEKAYAKLHFSYDSLAGGLVDVALREITGLCAERTLLRNASSPTESESLWRLVRENLDFGSVLGCIIHPEDARNLSAVSHQQDRAKQELPPSFRRSHTPRDITGEDSTVIPSSLRGLERRHAYTILATKLVAGERVLLLRNPWSFGNWLGPWSSISEQYERHRNELEAVFPQGELKDPANFIMSWKDFVDTFTSIVTTVQAKGLRTSAGSQWKGAYFTRDRWNEHTAGGGVEKETWFLNPTFHFRVSQPQTRVYIQLLLQDRRMENSKYSNDTLYSFSLCELERKDGKAPLRPTPRDIIPGSQPRTQQPAYTFHPTCSVDVFLGAGDYVLVPHTLDRGVFDAFCVFMYYDKPVVFDSALALYGNGAKEPLDFDRSWAAPTGPELDRSLTPALPAVGMSQAEVNMDPAQAVERKARAIRAEEIKDKLLGYAKAKGISPRKIISAFGGTSFLGRIEFKQRMVSLGFSVSEIPDKEFEALCHPETTIPAEKVRAIFEQDMLKHALNESKPESPQDDLMFRPPESTQGVLTVTAVEAQDLVLSSNAEVDRPWVESEFRRKKVRPIYTSPLVQISSRNVIIRVWQITKNPELPCVPTAYDVELGQEFGFASYATVSVDESQFEDGDFWKKTLEEWTKNHSIALQPMNNRLGSDNSSKGGQPARPAYVPDRLAYIQDVLEQMNVNVQLNPVPPSQTPQSTLDEEEKAFLKSITKDVNAPAAKKPASSSSVDPFTGLRSIYFGVVENVHSSPALRELDQVRNEEFYKLKQLAREKRRATVHEQSISDSLTKLGFSEEERQKYMKPKASETPANAASTDNAGEAAAASTSTSAATAQVKLSQQDLSELFWKEMFDKAFDLITYSRDNLQPGAWMEFKDAEPASGQNDRLIERFNQDGGRLIFSRVVNLPGEANVLHEQLSRSTDLETWFKQFDHDESGTIDRFEFSQALETLGLSLNDEEISALITHLDKNGDGLIEYPEFVEFAEGDLDIANIAEENMPMQKLLAALASPTIDRSQLTENWSFGKDWFKLRDLATQLRLLTKTCKMKQHRTVFALDARIAAPRVYRISHLFEKPEYFTQFLEQAARLGLENEARVVDSPTRARKVLVEVLAEMNGVNQAVFANGDDFAKIDVDAVMASLPGFVQEVLGVRRDFPKDGVRAGDFSEAVLKAYAKTVVADRFAEDLKNIKQSAEADADLEKMEAEMLERILDELNREVVPSDGPDNTPVICLTLAQQMRMLVDDAMIYCKAKRINRSTLARMLIPDNVTAVEMKLRHILQNRKESLERPSCFLVDVYVKGADKKLDVEKLLRTGQADSSVEGEGAVLDIQARNPASGRVLDLKNVPISKEEQASLPPRGSSWLPQSLQGPFGNSTPKHFLEDLMDRLLLCKDPNSERDRLLLSIKESKLKVEFIRKTLDSCSELPFFYQISERQVRFLVDQGQVKGCKNVVLDALRATPGNRVARSLCSLRSILTVVFEQTHGEFREEMSWAEFTAYLSERRDTMVQIKVLPGCEMFNTSLAKDGGLNPVFNAAFKCPYTPVKMTNRSLVLTRVSKIQEHYVILFVFHLPADSSKLGVVAYDPRSNDEFTLKVKLRDLYLRLRGKKGMRNVKKPLGKLPQLQPWGSPKRRMKSAFKAVQGATYFLKTEDLTHQDPVPKEIMYDADTLRILESYPIFQEKEGICIGADFPVHDEGVWERVLSHMVLGECLTPHLEFSAFNEIRKRAIQHKRLVGRVRFPLSAVTNSAGQLVDRWLSLSDEEGVERGKLHVSIRFDDFFKAFEPDEAESAAQSELFGEENAGDQALPDVPETECQVEDPKKVAEQVFRSAASAQELSHLAAKLREEVLATKTKLAESERSRSELEKTVRENETKLLRTRAEIEEQRRKLDQAERLALEREPKPPKRFSNVEEFEEFSVLQKKHEARIRELDNLRAENEKLKTVTDAREARLQSDIRELRKQLEEAEVKLRLEMSEKQQVLRRVEKANIEAQVNLVESVRGGLGPMEMVELRNKMAKNKGDRDKERRRRERWLQDRLGKEYTTYKKELENCIGSIERQLTSRRPDKPDQPIESFEQLLVANCKPNQQEMQIGADKFQETLLNFGLTIKPADMELLITHFDTGGDNHVSIDDFVDCLRDSFSRSGSMPVATQGFRGVQNVQRRNKYY